MRVDGNRLSFYGKNLRSIPDVLDRFPHVEILDLNLNKIEQIPESIRYMRSLRVIYAGSNELRSIPAALFELPNLRVLDIDHNKITELPDLFNQLGNLELLHVENNLLSHLPASLAPLLKSGLRLVAHSNPLVDPLPTIIGRGADALASYLSSLERTDNVTIYEARVLLVGEGNVGKSSLVAALTNSLFVANRDTTHGIEISRLALPHPSEPAQMNLSVWDFGGQDVYRVTHQFFFSERSLYLIVWKTREGVEANDVEGWIRRIRIRTGLDVRIVIVATHGDERRPELDYPRLVSLYGESIAGNCIVDNQSGNGIDNLRREIGKLAVDLPQMGQILPRSWMDTRTLVRHEAKSSPQISYDRLSQIARENGIVDETEIETVAELLHDLGEIVYFGDDDGLRNIVVLNPEWLTKAIGYVLEDSVTRDSGGILDHERLREIWSESKIGPSYPRHYHPYFLRLMEKFDVSYRLDDDSRSLVAQLVPWERPELPWNPSSPLGEGNRRLRLVCKLSEPAPGLVSWLTVRNHHSSTGLHWRHGVFLRHPVSTYDSEGIMLLADPTHLYIEVRAPSPDYFFALLRSSVEFLIRWRWPGLTFQMYVPCESDNHGVPCKGLFPLNGLLRRRERGPKSGNNTQWCLECDTEYDVGRLLTGFATMSTPFDIELQRLERGISEIREGVGRIETFAAEGADQLRRVLRALSMEVTDCPRLFTLSAPLAGPTLRRVTSIHYEVTLWCEEPGEWHPCDSARYAVDQPREWFARISPYASMIIKTLRLVLPIGGAALGLMIPADDYDAASKRIELAEAIVDGLPSGSYSGAIDRKLTDRSIIGVLSPSQGEGLRLLRAFLFKVDELRAFGGLRRALAQSGEYVWVCPEHYARYDPGLPRDLAS